MAKPAFFSAWNAAQKIYDPVNPATKVAEVIGGNVAKNINNPDPKQRWSNTCAVRMSYILNQSGVNIMPIRGKTVSGGDGNQYFFRVRDLIDYLRTTWGLPTVIKYPLSNGGELKDKKGIVLFEVSGWGDASGHATLFNGSKCYDHCYFNEPGTNYRTDRANFWSLS